MFNKVSILLHENSLLDSLITDGPIDSDFNFSDVISGCIFNTHVCGGGEYESAIFKVRMHFG